MYNIELENKLFYYLIDLLSNEKEEYFDIDDCLIDLEKLKENILNSVKKENDYIKFKLTIENKLDLMQYVEDKQFLIGFVNQEYLNEDGKKLQLIYDELYFQSVGQI
ncbi:hypothetical protein NYR90_09835 [Clostridioides difficile]|nr:hypothetical protein NYR90_09835 [Clostridioides difficile]